MTKPVPGFDKWIKTKYLEWMLSQEDNKPQYEFANYLGVSQPALSLWMSGKREPNKEHLKKLAQLFGPEVFMITGMVDDLDPILRFTQDNWSHLDEGDRLQIADIVTESVNRASNKPGTLNLEAETAP